MQASNEKESKLVSHFKSLTFKPKVIVLDLDGTLWPYFVDRHFSPPYKKHVRANGTTELEDSEGEIRRPYKDVPLIIKTLKEKCLDPNEGHLAIASIATEAIAKPAIEVFGWTKFITSHQIYYKSKNNHMSAIRDELGADKVGFQDFLFFDDDSSNIEPTTRLGVTMFLLDSRFGLDLESVLKGLTLFDEKKKSQSNVK